MSKKRLFLIDGYALLYRSYYAIRGLSNSKGLPTNAIFGFLSTLNKLREQEKPDYLAVVFDTKAPTFRHEMYDAYKANRKPKFKVRAYSRCGRCGRARAYLRKFGMCRICVRELASRGELPGVRKASW